jgi:hypothetical protein
MQPLTEISSAQLPQVSAHLAQAADSVRQDLTHQNSRIPVDYSPAQAVPVDSVHPQPSPD